MIKINQLKLPVGHSQKDLEDKIRKTLRIPSKETFHYEVMRRSLDARKKPSLFYVYCIYVTIRQENSIVKKLHQPSVSLVTETGYRFSEMGHERLNRRPVIVGAGPCGLFAAWQLTLAGYAPLILERGKQVEDRSADVERFWKTGILQPDSNVQFGEGGAGTFSDGKLNTVVKDPSGRNRYVLETFVKFGAPSDILYDAKPHIGTDKLVHVVREMRKTIQRYGGEILFQAHMEKLVQKNGKLTAVQYQKDGKTTEIFTSHCILAVGHSARDVFEMLYNANIPMMQKNFAVGMRIEHSQDWLNYAMYGREASPPELPVADYKLAVHLPNKHSLYTFCMCPGGEVVAASSERHRLVVNGMSNYARNGRNANSALLVGVSAAELQDSHPLAGMRFQQKLEEAAFQAGGGNYYAPACCVGDFLQKHVATGCGKIEPTYRPGVNWISPDEYLPAFVTETLRLGIPAMDRKIHGFAATDAVLTGVESRSSSPVRIVRNENCESVSLAGLYPCGEGAGYAGGITSAAVDGIRCAEQVLQAYL